MSVLLGLILRPVLFDPSVQAGTAIRLDVDGLVAGSELVLEGRVMAAVAEETASGLIETVYEIEVDRTFLGDDIYLRRIRLPGGVLEDGRGMLLAGMPRLKAGEDAMLFLSAESERGLRMPVGLAQGRYQIVTRMNGAKLAVRSQAGLGLMDPISGVVSEPDGRHVRDYADLIAEVESAVSVKRAGGKR